MLQTMLESNDIVRSDASVGRKRKTQNSALVARACVCCLPRTCFQSSLSRPCSVTSVTSVTGKGAPSGRRLGPQPLPVGAGRPACHCQLAFPLPTLRVVSSSAWHASLGAAPHRFARGQPVSRTALRGSPSAYPSAWSRSRSTRAGRPTTFRSLRSLHSKTGCPRAELRGGGCTPTSPASRRALLARCRVVSAWARFPAGGSPVLTLMALGRQFIRRCGKTLA